MTIQPHRRVHFEDDLVEFIKRHEVAEKALEERDVLVARQVQPDRAERNVRPVLHVHPADAHTRPVFRHDLPQRLKPVESACIILAGDHDRVRPRAQDIAFGLVARRRAVFRQVFPHKRIRRRAHQDVAPARQRPDWSHPQRHAVTIAQVGDQLTPQREIAGAGVLRDQDRDLFVHGEAGRTNRHLLRFGEDERPLGGGSQCGGSQETPMKATHVRPPEHVYTTRPDAFQRHGP